MQTVHIVIQWFGDGKTEGDILGVFSSERKARVFVEGMNDWSPALCNPEDGLWATRDYCVQIVTREVE